MLFLLTGCVNGVFHVTVNKDGSGDLNYKFAVDPALLSSSAKEKHNPLEEFKKMAKKDGFIVTQYKDRGYFGVEAKKHVKSISEDIGGGLINYISSSNNSEKSKIIIDKGFLFNVYSLKTNLDLKNMIPKDIPFSSMILEKMDLKMLLTIPMEVERQNASRMEIDDKEKLRTYEWDIIPGQDNEIYMEAKVLNISNVVLLVLLTIAAILGTIFLIRKRVKAQEI